MVFDILKKVIIKFVQFASFMLLYILVLGSLNPKGSRWRLLHVTDIEKSCKARPYTTVNYY